LIQKCSIRVNCTIKCLKILTCSKCYFQSILLVKNYSEYLFLKPKLLIYLYLSMKPLQIDTIKDTLPTKVLNLTPINHIFTSHQLAVKNQSGILMEKSENYWVAVLLMLGLSLVVLIRVTSPKKFFILIRSFFSFNAAKQLIREDYRLNKGSSLILIFLFLVNFPFLLFKINEYYKLFPYSFNDLYFYLILFFLVVLVYFIKFIFLKVIGALTRNQLLADEYAYYSFLSIKGAGLFVYPVLIFLEYSQLSSVSFIVAGLVICATFYVLRLVRGMLILINSDGVSIFHLFLYLCGLEIIPLIVIIKILVSGILVFS